MRTVHAATNIRSNTSDIIQAFLDPQQLQAWWGVSRALVVPQAGGVWTLAWEVSPEGIRYISTGIIHEFVPGKYLKVGQLVYLNADHDILGPMELEVRVTPLSGSLAKTELIQSGYQDGGNWDWYYNAVVTAWPISLEMLKRYLETPENGSSRTS